MVNGIPHFVADFPYWGEIPLEQMREVNRRAESGNWKSALLDSEDPLVRRASVMMLNLDRANWQFLVPLPRRSRVLDLGAGTGTNSHALALHFREVVAVEPVVERIEFMRHRFAQAALANVSIVRSSVWTLPFERDSFDMVAMNGVLEWVAEGVGREIPAPSQSRALRNVWEVLGAWRTPVFGNRKSVGPRLSSGLPGSALRATLCDRAVAEVGALVCQKKGTARWIPQLPVLRRRVSEASQTGGLHVRGRLSGPPHL